MKDPMEVTETLEILRIVERLPTPTRVIYTSIGKLLTQNDEGLRLVDLMMYWLRLNDSQRHGAIRLLQTIVEEAKDPLANDTTSENG